MNFNAALIIATWLTAAPPAPRAPEHWETVSQSDGITVASRRLPGSTLQEVRADFVINTAPEAVWQALLAVRNYPEFMRSIRYAQIQRYISEAEHIEYRRISQPQTSTYDEMLDVTAEAGVDAGTYYIHWRCVPGNAHGSVVRINTCEGAYAIEPTASGQTHVVYWNAADPKGSIPTVVFNEAETRDLPGMMRALAKHAVASQVATAY